AGSTSISAWSSPRCTKSTRTALAEERLRGALELGRPQPLLESLQFFLDPRGHSRLTPEKLFGRAQCAGGLRGNLVSKRHPLLCQPIVLDNVIDHAPGRSRSRINHGPKQQQLRRALVAEQPRQQQGARGFGNESELDEGHRQAGAARGDDKIAVE